ncbi:MAG: sugar phosphate isomerase/epimerase [Candidatus Hydrogenedentes bacterium]|nr:sugar phosphate isomerase/epimerase [Candidatus Hydrogenedentota bacterium]
MSMFKTQKKKMLFLAIVLGVYLPGAGLFAEGTQAMSKESTGMYVSIRESSLTQNTFATTQEGVAYLGIQSIELSLDRDFSVHAPDKEEKVILASDDDVRAFRARSESHGVHICAVLTACDFSAGDKESNVSWVVRAIEIADLLGAETVRIDSAMSKERELDFERRVQLFSYALSEVLARTPNSSITLGIENHGFQGNNLAFLLNIFQEVGSDRLGSTLDLGNFYWRGYPLSEVYGIISVLAPYTKHTHVKNINYPEEMREVTREAGWQYGRYACPLDEGDIDLEKALGILAKAGYRGNICIEDESLGKGKTNEERIAILKRDVDHLQAIIERLNP